MQQLDCGDERPYSLVFEKPTNKSHGRRSRRLGHRLKTSDINSRAWNDGDVIGRDANREKRISVIGIFHQCDVFFRVQRSAAETR